MIPAPAEGSTAPHDPPAARRPTATDRRTAARSTAPRRPTAALAAALVGLAAAAGCGDRPDRPGDRDEARPAATPVVDGPAPVLAVVDAAAPLPNAPPAPAPGARCGLVDRLDAPLGAPDGAGFQVRWPYGRVSNRYDGKLHAGEDWLALGGTSFGQPITSIGHGEVVYAQPWGWGTDQGVIIVRHHFPPGRLDAAGRPLSTVLSFYGHVDPPSVAVVRGQCVTRGQYLADIGKPRGRAHLHFEIRDHMPDTPGPGYWPSDPSRVGWHAPSALIARDRLLATPGVRWLAPFTPTLAAALGPSADGPLVVQIDGRALAGVAPADGRPAWRLATTAPVHAAVLDAAGDTVYAAHPDGVAAYAVAGAGAAGGAAPGGAARGGPAAARWTVPVALATGASPGASPATPRRTPILAALPEGGVLLAADGRLAALDRDGGARWAVDGVGDVEGLAVSDRFVVLTGAGGAAGWEAARAGGRAVVRPGLAGQPAIAGDGVFVQAADGITWLSLVAPEPPRHHPLAPGHIDDGQLVLLSDGGALATHRGPTVKRLLRFGPDGRLAWERDLAPLGRRLPRLVEAGGAVFAVGGRGDITALDLARGAGARRFAGLAAADADRLVDTPWAAALDDGTLLARLPLGDGQLVAFTVAEAVAGR